MNSNVGHEVKEVFYYKQSLLEDSTIYKCLTVLASEKTIQLVLLKVLLPATVCMKYGYSMR